MPIGTAKFPGRFPRLRDDPVAGHPVDRPGRLVQAGGEVPEEFRPGSDQVEDVAVDEGESGHLRGGQLDGTDAAREFVRDVHRLRIA